MPAVLATGKNLKKIKVFLGKNPNGTYEVKEGSIYQALGGGVLGGTSVPDSVAEKTEGSGEKA